MTDLAWVAFVIAPTIVLVIGVGAAQLYLRSTRAPLRRQDPATTPERRSR